jgi:hypothetical protein
LALVICGDDRPRFGDRAATPTYEAPKVVDIGDLVQVTAGSLTGNFTDKAFPIHTPFKDITFSN